MLKTLSAYKISCPLQATFSYTSSTDCMKFASWTGSNAINYNENSNVCETRICDPTNITLEMTTDAHNKFVLSSSLFSGECSNVERYSCQYICNFPKHEKEGTVAFFRLKHKMHCLARYSKKKHFVTNHQVVMHEQI